MVDANTQLSERRRLPNEPDCTCEGNPERVWPPRVSPTQHRFFCPWREWWLKQRMDRGR